MSEQTKRRAAMIEALGIGPVWKRRESNTTPSFGTIETEAEIAQLSSAAPAATFNLGAAQFPVVLPPDIHDVAPKAVARDVENGAAPSDEEVARMDWKQLQENVANCVKCDLCKSRRKTVFGTGDRKAKWLFVGEGPGRNEDMQGEPFVGPAGKLLDNMLLAIGLKRGENAYIANIVKCRPAGLDGKDRPPTAEEAAACLPYLERQIALMQPAIIVALGKSAAVSLLGLDAETPVSKMRGKLHRYRELPLVVTYHPAYLLRKLTDKNKAWDDLCMAMGVYEGEQR